MNLPLHRHLAMPSAMTAALVLVAMLAMPIAQFGRGAAAQEATPVPGAQTWTVLVNNVSPAGQNWSFNTFYPDALQVHPGDSIAFTLAPNQQAFHTVHLLALGMNPMEFYQGFSGGFVQPDLMQPGRLQRTFFGYQGNPPCGRAGQPACVNVDVTDDISFGVASPLLVNPPASGGTGNTSFTATVDPATRPGPYYFMSDVDGPSMIGRIDVLPFDQPVQSAAQLAETAERQYQADLVWLTGHDRTDFPAQASNPDGTKTWQVAAGSGGRVGVPNPAPAASADGTPQAGRSRAGASPQGQAPKEWLAINEFLPAQLVVIAGDTVTWTNDSPGSVAHAVAGFAAAPGDVPQTMDPFQPGCLTDDGGLLLPPAGSFAFDIWNTCPGSEVDNLTDASQPSAPSGDPYVEGDRTSGILLNQAYLNSAIGAGLPFASSYSVTFPEAGTYAYECPIHPGMSGVVVVIPKPHPR